MSFVKTTKEEILFTSLRLFAEKGFETVSTSMIASELGITKGAIYRHFKNKRDIFNSIISKMFELDAQQAKDNNVPVKEYSEDEESYMDTSLDDLCGFVNAQFMFWTENEFAKLFRRMITIEQFKNPEMNRLYQDTIASGPVKYTEDLMNEMLSRGHLTDTAAELGPKCLAIQLFAPLAVSIQMFDGGEDSEKIKKNLCSITRNFENQWLR